MSDSIVAYRYAKALIDLASEQKALKEVNEDMILFEQVCKENDEFTALMASPIIRHEKKQNILDRLFKGKVNTVTYSIFKILTSKNREKLILPIALEFQKLYDKQFAIQKVSVRSATKLSQAQKEEIIKITKEKTNNSIILEESIDESLIGGFVLTIGDTQIDTSVKKKLNNLKLALA
jgi:F-type H+-transporting ATPase subunit delta